MMRLEFYEQSRYAFCAFFGLYRLHFFSNFNIGLFKIFSPGKLDFSLLFHQITISFINRLKFLYGTVSIPCSRHVTFFLREKSILPSFESFPVFLGTFSNF